MSTLFLLQKARLRLALLWALCATCACRGDTRSLVTLDVQLDASSRATQVRVHVQPPDAGATFLFEVPEAAQGSEPHTVPLGLYVSVDGPREVMLEVSGWHDEVQHTEAVTLALLVKPGEVSRAASPVRLQARGMDVEPNTSLPDAAADVEATVDAGDSAPCIEAAACAPPVVVSTSPARGETGVSPNAMLVVRFDQPMDKLSVQSALTTSPEIELGATSLAWNADGNELTIRPQKAMPMAMGDLAVEARELFFALGSGAMNRRGVPLAESLSISFRTLRQVTSHCGVINSLSAELYSSGPWNHANFTVGAYESSGLGNWTTRTAMSFACENLPNTVRDIDRAVLHVLQHRFTPRVPFEIEVDHVRFEKLDSNTYGQKPLRKGIARVPDTQDGWKHLDVTDAVREDVSERVQRHGRSQFRIGPLPDSPAQPGSVGYGSSSGDRAPYLELRYFLP